MVSLKLLLLTVRLRVTIESHPLWLPPSMVNVGASMGVSVYSIPCQVKESQAMTVVSPYVLWLTMRLRVTIESQPLWFPPSMVNVGASRGVSVYSIPCQEKDSQATTVVSPYVFCFTTTVSSALPLHPFVSTTVTVYVVVVSGETIMYACVLSVFQWYVSGVLLVIVG